MPVSWSSLNNYLTYLLKIKTKAIVHQRSSLKLWRPKSRHIRMSQYGMVYLLLSELDPITKFYNISLKRTSNTYTFTKFKYNHVVGRATSGYKIPPPNSHYFDGLSFWYAFRQNFLLERTNRESEEENRVASTTYKLSKEITRSCNLRFIWTLNA